MNAYITWWTEEDGNLWCTRSSVELPSRTIAHHNHQPCTVIRRLFSVLQHIPRHPCLMTDNYLFGCSCNNDFFWPLSKCTQYEERRSKFTLLGQYSHPRLHWIGNCNLTIIFYNEALELYASFYFGNVNSCLYSAKNKTINNRDFPSSL